MSTKRKLVIVDDDFHSHTFDGDPQIELLKWRGVKKPTGLRGFATVDYYGLVLPNMPVKITEDGEHWVGLPGRRLLYWARDAEPFARAVVAALIGTISRVRVPTHRLMTKTYGPDEKPTVEEVMKDLDE